MEDNARYSLSLSSDYRALKYRRCRVTRHIDSVGDRRGKSEHVVRFCRSTDLTIITARNPQTISVGN